MKLSMIIRRASQKQNTDEDGEEDEEEERVARVSSAKKYHDKLQDDPDASRHLSDPRLSRRARPARGLGLKPPPREFGWSSSQQLPPLIKILSTTFKSIYLIMLIQLFVISLISLTSHCEHLDRGPIDNRQRHQSHHHQQQQQPYIHHHTHRHHPRLPRSSSPTVQPLLDTPRLKTGLQVRLDESITPTGDHHPIAGLIESAPAARLPVKSSWQRRSGPDGHRTIRSSIGGDDAESNASNASVAQAKVAALATKLEQWLKCYRMNLLFTQQQQRLSSALSSSHNHQDEVNSGGGPLPPASPQPQGASDDRRPHEPEPVTCPAHFDGHLCWPEARIGQQIRLACPQINNLLAVGSPKAIDAFLAPGNQPNPLVTATTNQQPLKSVIATIQRQQDSLNGGDTNQTQEITSANIQSIKPTGSRAGITSTLTAASSINQSNQMTDGGSSSSSSSYDERWPISGGGAGLSGDKHVAEEKLTPGTRQELRFARRTCGSLASPSDDSSGQLGRWQNDADYSDCKLSANNLFDPTDELVALNDGQDLSSNDRELFENLREQLERIEPSIDPYSDPEWLEQWTLCIGEVIRRQRANNNNNQDGESRRHEPQHNSTGYCPIIFDGWRCWPATEAGEIAYVNCPKNQPGFSAERKAYKICTLQGDWYRHPETNRYWSNYTTCVDTVDLAFRTKILNLYVIGNLISLIALAVSLIIFFSFKSLNCTRVTIHKNLFLSFITNNLMWIIWYTYVVNDADLLQSNPLGCRLWHILLHYFLVSNYFWMFCEGLYLHTLLVVTFVSEDKILKWFYLLGWLSPVPIIVTYAYNRSYDEYYTNFCWMEESPHNVILMAPIGFSLLLNLIFLINIVRVLVTKLRANNSPDTHQTRKAVRATLILIPLLGLHYMLTPFRPEAKSEWEVYYEIIAAVCTSFQGLCVAMLFCFCNGEVMNAIKKRLKDSIVFKRDSKRTMRSRSNTAISNVFNSVGVTNNNNHINQNNGQNQNPRRGPFDAGQTARSNVSSSSSAYGNLMSNQLQGQPMMTNKRTPNGNDNSTTNQPASQRTSVLTTNTELSPVRQHPHRQRANGSPTGSTIETKLMFKSPSQQTDDLIADETIKLLGPTGETNNNNNNDDINVATGGSNEAAC